MQLNAFRIINCFGFDDSGWIDLSDPKNIIYILGRNSSGKTSFLTALKYFAFGMIPANYGLVKNYDRPDDNPRSLQARFTFDARTISLDKFMLAVLNRLSVTAGLDVKHLNSYTEVKGFLEDVRTIYQEFLASLAGDETILVHKYDDGDYAFYTDKTYQAREQRETAVVDALKRNIPRGALRVGAGTTQYPVNFSFYDAENQLFRQFPKIELITNESYSLIDPLPFEITREVVDQNRAANITEKNKVLDAFIQFLGQDELDRFLEKKSPTIRNEMLGKMQAKVNLLCDKVSQATSRTNKADSDLFTIQLYSGTGLEVHVQTGTKPSEYRFISNNTKFLFSYYLYREVNRISGDILLFDEPNNGFHASAQVSLLRFLQTLAKTKQVILSTHSEHLIDTEHLPGIRIMGVDENNALLVLKGFTKRGNQQKGKPDYLAYQPIFDAIGSNYISKINLRDKVVITEGIIDLYYLKAFKKVLRHRVLLNLAPAQGETTIPKLIPLLVSQGISFRILIDEGSTRKRLEKEWNIDPQYIHEVRVPDEYRTLGATAGIEDLFSKSDYAKLLQEVNHTPTADFATMSNSAYGKKNEIKTRVAFHLYKNCGDFNKSYFDALTIANFQAVLDFCNGNTWYSV
jgi:AAA15 family ATPase/GTPase